MNRSHPALLSCCAFALCASCGRTPSGPADAAPSASASVPASASASAAYAGKVEPPGDPVADLVSRTYALSMADDLVHAGTTAGVVSWSFRDPAKPVRLATLVLPGSVSGLTSFGPSGSLLAVSTGPTGLVIVDASNVARGRLDRTSEAPWKASDRKNCHATWNVRVPEPKRAFVACGTGGLAEVDLSVLSHPVVSRSLEIDGYVRDLAVLDASSGVPADKASPRKLAVAAGEAGLVIAEFPAAGEPRVLAKLPTKGESRSLEVRDGIAYVADGAAGVRIVDLHDPAHPAELAAFDPGTVDMARGVAVHGKSVFACLGDSGIVALDVSEPKKPRRTAAIDPNRAVNRALVSDTRLFAANDAGGILVMDLAKAGEPRQIFPVPGKK